VLRIYHLDRGYDGMVERLRSVGARIARVADDVRDPELIRKAFEG
jgi:UDP-N-acetylglucosamine enolpyruvyl transferase